MTHEEQDPAAVLRALADSMVIEAEDTGSEKLREDAEAIGPRAPRPRGPVTPKDVEPGLRLNLSLQGAEFMRTARLAGQSPEDWLAAQARIKGPAWTTAAALALACREEVKVKGLADDIGRANRDRDEARRALATSQDEVKAKDRIIEGKDALIDNLFQRMRAIENQRAAARRVQAKEPK